MKYVILQLAILFSLSSNAANWDLFPLNQKSYYQTQGQPDYIQMVSFDSATYQTGVRWLFNRKKINNELTGGCYDQIYGQVYWLQYPDLSIIDTLAYQNDTAVYWSKYTTQSMFFLPQAQAGASWSFPGYSQITITCTSVSLDTVLGLMDSVKTFSLQESVISSPDPISVHALRLSKSFGLIEFIDFEDFFYHPSNSYFKLYQLVGVTDSFQTHGFVQPSAFSYLPYHAGDILLWNHHFDNGGNWSNPNYDDYFRDSITSVSVYTDSLVYQYDRRSLWHSGQTTFSSGSFRKFAKEIELKLLNTPPFSICVTPEIWGSEGINIIVDTVFGGNQTERKFIKDGSYVDTNSCMIYPVFDYGYDITFNDHLGVTLICEWFNSSSTCDILTGASINGHVYGNLTLPVGIPEGPGNKIVKCYPVPAGDNIYFETSSFENASIRIFNNLGKEIVVIENYNSKEAVNISDLQPGTYYSSILIDGITLHARFCKL